MPTSTATRSFPTSRLERVAADCESEQHDADDENDYPHAFDVYDASRSVRDERT